MVIQYELEKLNQGIIILTESKKKGNGIDKLSHYTHFYTGVPKQVARLVSILVKNKSSMAKIGDKIVS